MTSRRPQYRTRRDENQAQIIAELAQVPGFEVWDVSTLTDAQCPGDILVLDRATVRWGVFEIKTETGRPSKAQREMSDFVPIVRKTEDVLKWFGRI